MNKKAKISREKYGEIEAQSAAARELLEDERFEFFRTYIKNAIDYCESTILNNTIRDVQEVVPVSDKITRIFKTPKKVQVDELTGQYKWIKKFQDDLTYFSTQQAELDEGIKKGLVLFEGEIGKDVTG